VEFALPSVDGEPPPPVCGVDELMLPELFWF
jgi:hypothetical protein